MSNARPAGLRGFAAELSMRKNNDKSGYVFLIAVVPARDRVRARAAFLQVRRMTLAFVTLAGAGLSTFYYCMTTLQISRGAASGQAVSMDIGTIIGLMALNFVVSIALVMGLPWLLFKLIKALWAARPVIAAS